MTVVSTTKTKRPMIDVENVSKDYVIGTADLSESFREMVARAVTAPLRRFRELSSNVGAEQTFHALKDVSFSVDEGRVLGIIGKNGAGKSTLLKVLAGITEPTRGRVVLRGRTASLLEVGTGFHHELTGRENIFLNGSILGMSRREIAQKFDEIVAFSEIDQFLDTPVKRYSSGMYMRLAFAVAAHLDPEILLVDEVLAVGDAAFQKKCLGKMSEVASGGRTVIFVSHNMNAVEELVSDVVWIDKGAVVEHTEDVRGVIRRYLAAGSAAGATGWTNDTPDVEFHPLVTPLSLSAHDDKGAPLTHALGADASLTVRVSFRLTALDDALTLGIALYDDDDRVLFWSYQTDSAETQWPKLVVGVNTIETKVPAHLLNEGAYRIEFIGGLHFREWILEPRRNAPAINIEVRGSLSDSPLWVSARPGALAPHLPWKVK